MLSFKNNKEIGLMLDEYGIKHGPVVGTTRSLYEKKLREVMAKERRSKPPSDETFHRAEHAKPRYNQQRRPRRKEGSEGRYPASRFEYVDEDAVSEPNVYRLQAPSHGVAPERHRAAPPRPRTWSSVLLWILLLLFLLVMGILIFINIEPAEMFRILN